MNIEFLFDELTFCNIGNPQEFHQKPITYFREVLSCALNPALIDNPSINLDARNRAKAVLKEIISTGSYTHSLGIPLVRANVCKYIARMDKVPEPKLD
jgi:alanine transaminase